MAPCQSAIRSNQHLSPCSLRGSHQTRLEWLRQVVDGTTFTPDVIFIGLGPLEKELLGSFWGRRSFLKITLPTAKPSHSHPTTLQGTKGVPFACSLTEALPGPPCLQAEDVPFPWSLGSIVTSHSRWQILPSPPPTLVLLPLTYCQQPRLISLHWVCALLL